MSHNTRSQVISRLADAMLELEAERGSCQLNDLLERGFTAAELTANSVEARTLAARRRAIRQAHQ